ncbi:MAG TPA: alpha/beta hydrolase [Gemmatimonadaceae bacterium]|nr:alpha/beta hydrolase [Gemmatimonadaceae bacterium]
MGLVICNPFGHEALCAHRSLRHFAIAAADSGVPSLRFDYDGTGDSVGEDRDPDRWNAWIASVHHAVDEMRASTGVRRVCLLGVRLGGALAALAASDREDISGLVAIAPVVAGAAWLREQKALQLILGLAEPPPGVPVEKGLQESAGFPITAETRDAIAAVNLLGMASPPAPEVLVLDREDFPPNERWVDRLERIGAHVDHRRVPGYAEMVLDPHDAVVPDGMVRAVADWLRERTAAIPAIALAPSAPPPGPVRFLAAPGVEETAGYLDETGTLFGIVTAPTGVERPTRAIVLLNAGAVYHIGPNRLHVRLARRWAARGYLVLRLDIAGIGDSAPRPGEPENVVYSPFAVRDTAVALAHLREHWGVSGICALGLCSGAYHAFQSVVAGLSLNAVVIINPLVFFWKPGMSLAYPAHKVAEAAQQYRRSALQPEKWKKLLSGKVDLGAVLHVAARHGASLAAGWFRDIARAVGRPVPDDLGAELEAVARRNVALRFVFVAGDPGEELLRVGGGSALRSLLRRQLVHIQRIDGPDHTFTPVWSHDTLIATLESALEMR